MMMMKNHLGLHDSLSHCYTISKALSCRVHVICTSGPVGQWETSLLSLARVTHAKPLQGGSHLIEFCDQECSYIHIINDKSFWKQYEVKVEKNRLFEVSSFFVFFKSFKWGPPFKNLIKLNHLLCILKEPPLFGVIYVSHSVVFSSHTLHIVRLLKVGTNN